MKKKKRNTSSGKEFENVIACMGEELHGYTIVPYKEYIKNTSQYCHKIIIVKNWPYPSIKSTNRVGRQEFVLVFPPGKYNKIDSVKCDQDGYVRIRIDCKMQKVSGSCDEKLPFCYLNALDKRFPEGNFVLVIGGNGASEGMINWVKEKGSKLTHMNFYVYHLGEFMDFIRQVAKG